jgi:tetratricopeptide (TPR) repeat protein
MKKILLLFIFFIPILLISQVPEKNIRISRQAYNSAIDNIKAANFQVALTFLDASLDLDPVFQEALLQRAKVKVELGLIPDALKDFLQASRINDKNGEPFFYLGYLQFNGDTGSNIIENLNLAIQKEYRTPQSYYNRGLYRLLVNEYSGAIEDFTSSIGLQTDFAFAYHDRAVAKYRLGDLQGALQDYRNATGFNHNFPLAFINLGSVKIELGDYSGAIEDYSVALSLDSTLFIAYNNRGSAKYFLGDINGAMDDFNRALLYSESFNPALNNKACVLIKDAGLNEALSIFNEIISSDTGFAKAYLNRGLVKELQGDLEGACADWRKAHEMGLTEARNYIKECN